MTLKPTTLALVLGAALLGGVVYFTQSQPDPQSASGGQSASEPAELFDFEESQVTALAITTPLRSLQFEKTADGAWQMTAPEAAAANDASVAYLLNLLATGQSVRTLTVPTGDRNQFGLHQPFAEVEVTLETQDTHRFILGEYDFNRQFIYAQANPETPGEETGDGMEVLLVSPDFENAINRPLEDWQQPAIPPQDPLAPSPEATTTPEATTIPEPEAP